MGYTTISFDAWEFSKIESTDYFFSYYNKPYSLTERLNKFEALSIKTTSISFILALFPKISDLVLPILNQPNLIERDVTLYNLDSLEDSISISGPKFVFAHIVSPHRPFVFGANGEYLHQTPDFYNGYTMAIDYLNFRILHLIQKILNNSPNEPIIIIQSDHGGEIPYFGREGRIANQTLYIYQTEGGKLFILRSPPLILSE
ncbi:MAG: hypothetical protein HON98_01690 [Chloroflexi bacterium]|jgi:hypothetical protein|nr:hypothetical protein [Chloroflexota bacterium]MBT3670629.1 hypothetical protein [Chloroflexota bacterium]MBT4002000.1 hypothetical protein [Chloroflexota bacterium]MBT4304132.1 hypothetical protein [Chloroflexota bacterium]MBT4683045.1 hypothetical protein [Chloroflexota bacterium]